MLHEILGVEGFKFVDQINQPVDTFTLYMTAERREGIKQDIISLKPLRINLIPLPSRQRCCSIISAMASILWKPALWLCYEPISLNSRIVQEVVGVFFR